MISHPRLRIPIQHTLKESSREGLDWFRRDTGVGLVVRRPGLWAQEIRKIKWPWLSYYRDCCCSLGGSGRCGYDNRSSLSCAGRSARGLNSGRARFDYGCFRGLGGGGAGHEYGALAQLAGVWKLERWLPDACVASLWFVGLWMLMRWLSDGGIDEPLCGGLWDSMGKASDCCSEHCV